MGHSLYGVVRQENLISNVKILSTIESDRKGRLFSAIDKRDHQLLGQMLVQDAKFCFSSHFKGETIVYRICVLQTWLKGLKLVLSALKQFEKEYPGTAEHVLNYKKATKTPLMMIAPHPPFEMALRLLKWPQVDVNAKSHFVKHWFF